jgi:phenylalanyl-tRNA synthetase beta chain
MKITYNWLKDFVDIKISPRELADKLTMAGLEVVSLEEKSGDFVLEIEITSNRPDWLSLSGIAREVAAITNAKLKVENYKPTKKIKNRSSLKIEIENKKDCSLYAARIINGVKVGPSPEWLSKRLELVGCRSVNNLVDITNYVLFELGEPLHAFDLDKLIQDKIFVRRGKLGEKILTIDGIERTLSRNILVIADRERSVAIAGVMGGSNTEVGFTTKNILLEAAVFNPVLVRRGRQELGLQSEASYRFERGVDTGIAEKASSRAVELISEICGGSEILYKVNGSVKPKAREIILNLPDLTRILGVNISAIKVKQILSKLGFIVKERSKNVFSVGIPSFRQDVNLPEDLIEEIARIFGYEHIPISLPKVLPKVNIRERRDLVSNIKNILIGLGLNEAITYSLTDSKILNDLNPAFGAIEIMNPLSQEQGFLRTTLLPGLIRAIAHNLNQKLEYAALFEIGNVFLRINNTPHEELRLGIALSGTKKMLLNEAAFKDELGLLNLKGIIEALFTRLGIKNYEFINQAHGFKVDICLNKEPVGLISTLDSALLDKFNIKNKDVFTLEVSLEKILTLANLGKRYVPLPRYPGITRDISFILKQENSVKDLLSVLQEKGRPLLRSLEITDYYKGRQIPAGYRGLTLSCTYGSSERTLTEEEIIPVHKLICSMLTELFSAKIR